MKNITQTEVSDYATKHGITYVEAKKILLKPASKPSKSIKEED